jgi:Tfp pilus assembly protein PilE
MNIIDLLVTIVVVTILITIALAVVTYVAYKLRLARQPSTLDRAEDGLRYFVQYVPRGMTTEYDDAGPGTEIHAAEA